MQQLESRRLVLRPLSESDGPVLFRFRSDPAVMQYMDTASMESIEQAYQMINAIHHRFTQEQIPLWALSLKEDEEKRMIGYAGYTKFSPAHYRAEIAFVTDPIFWGRGLISEALPKVLEYGFQTMNLHSVAASINPNNSASAHILEKFNFQKEAHFKESMYFNGRFLDDVIYSLLKINYKPPTDNR